MTYILPSAPPPVRRRGLSRLGAVPVNTLRSRVAAPRFTSSSGASISQSWGSNPPTYSGGFSPYGTNSGSGYNYGSGSGGSSSFRRRRGSQQQSQTNVNTTGAPSTIEKYDQYGNPVYSVPPPGQQVTGYDAAGTPLYGSSSGSVPAGSILPTSAITGYDAAGTPIYSSAPPGQTITGYDAYGNPIYSGSAASASLLTSSSAAVPASAAAAPATTADSSGYQSVLDWLSEQTLISGFPNWGVVVAAGGAFLLIQSRMGRR